MGLFDWLFGQFIDVIEWTDDSSDTMVYRFNRHGNEIKYGAKLTVRESQVAVFVNEGAIADILTPGIYELETNNIPILTSLQHWDHGFNSPFKAEVYFVNTKRFTDLKWGTKNPIMLRDPEFSMVRLRAFGTYEIRVSDVKVFLNEIVGTDGHFTTDEIESQLTNHILSKFATILGENKVPVLDLAANYKTFGDYITQNIAPSIKEYGLELTHMLVENISLPDEVEKALDTRTSREMTGDLQKHVQYQSGQALGNSEGGAMSDMVGMGAGIAMGQQMAESMKQDNTPTTPPPLPNTQTYYIALNGESKGPFDISAIKTYIQNNTLLKETLVWSEGMDGWEEAGLVLKEHFENTPPPLH
ncbi:MAG: Putative virion core protein (lumpy skin disease virus) [uncultured Sulfurovum sp.]|uniref:Virion core protein (Lumpy skin disease virus) n=1 Tax=uncultured Sulfurovum sp. TaxID=269237 RepID=A0A6S6RXQ6_9BACT|nr:MAG: Putative virion core protein (lumpy skin disease virus) [uncultured Sulfurovum sp.]